MIGCDSPELLAELRASDSYLVHGLDRDPGKVAAARSYLREKGLYGSVTAARWDGSATAVCRQPREPPRDPGCGMRDSG